MQKFYANFDFYLCMKKNYFLFELCLCAMLAILLNACSTTKTTTTTQNNNSKKMVKAVKGGGYYLDDGPGDYIPADLDNIPDAVPKLEPLHKPAMKPYNVLGMSYTPNTKLQPYKQKGIASWYGKKFHGQKTSIGEPYDMFAMTAAHTTLVLPSYVRVTRVANGKSVVVRVIDRGPFHTGRIIDLSYTAAHKLGIIKGGSAEVIVEAILPDGVETTTNNNSPSLIADLNAINTKIINTKTVTKNSNLNKFNETNNTPLIIDNIDNNINEQNTNTTVKELQNLAKEEQINAKNLATTRGFFIQLGAFSNLENAENLKNHISRQLDWLSETPKIYPGDNLHKLQIGPYKTRNAANKIAERIASETGYKPALIQK